MRSRVRPTHFAELISTSAANLHLSEEPVFDRFPDATAGLTKLELRRLQDAELQRRLKAGLRTVRRPQGRTQG